MAGRRWRVLARRWRMRFRWWQPISAATVAVDLLSTVDNGRSQRQQWWQRRQVILDDSVGGSHITKTDNPQSECGSAQSAGCVIKRSCDPLRHHNHLRWLLHAWVRVLQMFVRFSILHCMHAACVAATIRVVGILRNAKLRNDNMQTGLWKEHAKLWTWQFCAIATSKNLIN